MAECRDHALADRRPVLRFRPHAEPLRLIRGIYSWKETVGDNLITPDASGEHIRIEGRVLDGDGMPITDAMIEIWQADAQAATPMRATTARPNTRFKGFGRSATDKEGVFSFDTVKPGAVPGPNGKPQAPHIVVGMFARGMLRQIYTRIYFADEAGNAADPILTLCRPTAAGR